ncbi:DUF3309 domain-containing protein [Nitrospirillum sp. BR 11752]|uniref:DUF3309 domain-containing protein n=1 Tax=Nitrospirillum sp. BR 11752 TaxID=3104293 RepID=UPI002EC96713|nr:DUF3309 domain-containing protein [Nitrospirillum sp. BR 11752]
MPDIPYSADKPFYVSANLQKHVLVIMIFHDRNAFRFRREAAMNLGTIILIILILFLIGALPTWPHSVHWGYYPAGGLGTVIVIVLILILIGRL